MKDNKELFKARCSRLGALFTNPRSKSELLSQTCKTYLDEWYIENLFGVRKEIVSRYTDKGLNLEDSAISIYSKTFGVDAQKNDEFFADDFIQGTPDIVLDDRIVDIKCSYSAFSFPMLEKDLPNKDYFYQLQGYMRLCNKQSAEVCYFLLDTPDDIILREAKSIMYKEQLPDDFLDIIIAEVKENHTYSHIPIEKRIKRFVIQRDEDVIKDMENRVILCRDYISSIGI